MTEISQNIMQNLQEWEIITHDLIMIGRIVLPGKYLAAFILTETKLA